MVVCTYFLRGACKFGDHCRNDHPQKGGGFGNATWTNSRNNTGKNAIFTSDTMKNDLTPLHDKPSWPLSSYGTSKFEPTLLNGLDESPEELRVRAFLAQRSGNVAEYVAYEASKISAAEQVYNNALRNIDEAFAKASEISGATKSNLNSAFGSTTTGFGNTSAFGGRSTVSAFGTAFNTPATSGTCAFSQPTPAFGQTQQPSSIFGQPFTQQATPGFGQTQPSSIFGQSSQPSSLIKPSSGAFGNVTGTGTNSPFGTTGGFSSFSGSPSAFGINTTNAAPPTSAFGQTGFGAASPTPTQQASGFSSFAPSTSAFGAPSAFGALPEKPSGFAALPPKPQTSGFASLPPKPQTSMFATTSPFGAPQGPSTSNPFASSNQPNFPTSSSNLSTTSSFTLAEPESSQSSFSNPPLSAFPMASPSPSISGGVAGTVSGPPDFVNAASQYRPGLTPYDLNLPDDYQQSLPQDALEAFKSQKFEWGKVPDWVPPLELR